MDETLTCGVTLRLVDQDSDLYLDMALEMLSVIRECEQKDKDCVMIVPVGPTGQYPILAKLVNRLDISLRRVHFFNMDEYMLTPEQPIGPDDALSFHRRMNSEFYDRVRPELNIPENQRHFPEPGHEREYDALLEALGGADACFGGLGINGHIAFNEPPEAGDPITVDGFAALGTRVLPISRETRTINANGYLRGDIRAMPPFCITVGMKQILMSRRFYIALNTPWQHGIARRVFEEPVQPQIPMTLLRRCKNVLFCTTKSIGEGLLS